MFRGSTSPAPAPALHDRDVVEPDLRPRRRARLTATIASPATTAADEHPGVWARRGRARPARATHRRSGAGWSLAIETHGDRDAARDLRPPRAPGQHREQQRPVRERVPGVEVAEQHGDRERQHERRDRRSRGPPSGQRRAARAGREPRRDQPEPERRPDRPTAPARRRPAATRPASSPGRPAAGTSRTARRRRATRPRASPGRTGSGRRATCRAPSSSSARSKPARGGSLWQQRPADPRDAGPRDDAGDHPRSEAVGVERAPAGRGGRVRCGRHGGTIRGRGGFPSRVERGPGSQFVPPWMTRSRC